MRGAQVRCLPIYDATSSSQTALVVPSVTDSAGEASAIEAAGQSLRRDSDGSVASDLSSLGSERGSVSANGKEMELLPIFED